MPQHDVSTLETHPTFTHTHTHTHIHTGTGLALEALGGTNTQNFISVAVAAEAWEYLKTVPPNVFHALSCFRTYCIGCGSDVGVVVEGEGEAAAEGAAADSFATRRWRRTSGESDKERESQKTLRFIWFLNGEKLKRSVEAIKIEWGDASTSDGGGGV
jgi:hypothetical protein